MTCTFCRKDTIRRPTNGTIDIPLRVPAKQADISTLFFFLFFFERLFWQNRWSCNIVPVIYLKVKSILLAPLECTTPVTRCSFSTFFIFGKCLIDDYSWMKKKKKSLRFVFVSKELATINHRLHWSKAILCFGCSGQLSNTTIRQLVKHKTEMSVCLCAMLCCVSYLKPDMSHLLAVH